MQRKGTLEVHVQPRARSSGLVELRDGVLFVRVAAPPRAGRANQALLTLIADTLDVPKSNLDIIRGHTSRHKVLAVQGLSPEELERRLAQVVARMEK